MQFYRLSARKVEAKTSRKHETIHTGWVCFCLPLCCHATESHIKVRYLLKPPNQILKLQPSRNLYLYYIILYMQGSLHSLTNHLPWTLGLPSPQVSFNCEPLAFSCNVQTTSSHRWNIMACRWSKTSGSSKLSCSWSTRSASATCRIYAMHMSQNPPMALQPHSQTVDVGEHHHRQFPVALYSCCKHAFIKN